MSMPDFPLQYIRSCITAKERASKIVDQHGFSMKNLPVPFVSEAYVDCKNDKAVLKSRRTIETGETISLFPLVLLSHTVPSVRFKDNQSITHHFTQIDLSFYDDTYKMFEYDLHFIVHQCSHTANSISALKIFEEQELVILTRAIRRIEKGSIITADFGAHDYTGYDSDGDICRCGHPECSRKLQGFMNYSVTTQDKMLQDKRIDIACAARHYFENINVPNTKHKIEIQYIHALTEEEKFIFFNELNDLM